MKVHVITKLSTRFPKDDDSDNNFVEVYRDKSIAEYRLKELNDSREYGYYYKRNEANLV